jgi:hypothetical protein
MHSEFWSETIWRSRHNGRIILKYCREIGRDDVAQNRVQALLTKVTYFRGP